MNLSRSQRTELRRQNGAVLIISLVLMLILTILGLTAANTTTLQSKMSINMADRNMALQAAEHAMRIAENQLQTWINEQNAIIRYDSTKKGEYQGNGVYIFDEAAAKQPWELGTAKWDSTDSTDAGAISHGDVTMPTTKNPRYMIAVSPDNVNAQQVALEGAGQGELPDLVGRRYTITAMGWGAQDNTRVKIQVEYYSPF